MRLFSTIKQHRISFALSLAVIVLMLLHASDKVPLQFVHKLENYSYDARLKLLMPNTIDNRIVIVDIDEKSLLEQGRWPWGRDKIALLVNQLFTTYQINTLGFDVVFAEKDESAGLKNLEWLRQNDLKDDSRFISALNNIKPQLDYDQLLANSFKNRKIVLGYYFQTSGDINHVGQLPTASFSQNDFASQEIAFVEASGFGANLPVLQQNALTAGHFNPEPDADGITRKVAVLIKYGNQYYDSLAVEVARVYLQNQPLIAQFASQGAAEDYAGLESFRLADKHIPVDGDVATLVPYRGVQGSFKYVSATDVLNNKVRLETLKNKIVLVGTTAAGLLDLRATPVQGNYPGVEVHANVISGILDDNLKQRTAYTNAAEFIVLLVVGLLLALFLPVLNPLKATLLTIVVLVVVLAINFASWQYANLVLPIASSLLMIGLIYLLNMSYGFFVESRGKRQLTGLFGQYVPPELVQEMAKNPEKIDMAGESRELTVLFSDIRGFTQISESLDPKQLTQMMNEFLTPMTKIIHEHRGTIDKYMGDAIMAFWGAPLKDENHAQNALNAALQMNAATKSINEKFAKKGWSAIRMGFGLNTGNMVVGNMGSSFRMAYTVMGDSVNLGSRLEGLTKYYGVDIIVSEFVKAQTPDMLYRELDLVRVKGKDKPVAIFEPLGLAETLTKETVEALHLHQEMLQHYRNGDWSLAEKPLKALEKIATDDGNSALIVLYKERIAQFKKVPPANNWDGVFNHDSK
jgi:adenylate cyclase